MADYSELFNKLKTMADDVPIGVDVTLSYRFRSESTGYDRQQPPILLQHLQMEKRRATGVDSAELVPETATPANPVTPCQTLSEVKTSDVFPMAEFIKLEDMNKTKQQSDLYEQVQLE